MTALIFLARGSSELAELAAAVLRILTYPINLLLQQETLIASFPMDAILDDPLFAYGIGVVATSFVVINSYLWAFVVCHIKWQWRVSQADGTEKASALTAGATEVG